MDHVNVWMESKFYLKTEFLKFIMLLEEMYWDELVDEEMLDELNFPNEVIPKTSGVLEASNTISWGDFQWLNKAFSDKFDFVFKVKRN